MVTIIMLNQSQGAGRRNAIVLMFQLHRAFPHTTDNERVHVAPAIEMSEQHSHQTRAPCTHSFTVPLPLTPLLVGLPFLAHILQGQCQT